MGLSLLIAAGITSAVFSAVDLPVRLVTIEQHKNLIGDLHDIPRLRIEVNELSSRVARLEQARVNLPQKSEFETTSAFRERLSSYSTEVIRELLIALDKLNETRSRLLLLEKGIERRIDTMHILVSLRMESFDADRRLASFTPIQRILPEAYSSKHRAGILLSAKPGAYPCDVDTARKLRAASNDGNLLCLMKLKDAKLRVSEANVRIPKTGGEKFGEAALLLGVILLHEAINPDAEIPMIPASDSEKIVPSFMIEVTGFSELSFDSFLAGGVVLRSNVSPDSESAPGDAAADAANSSENVEYQDSNPSIALSEAELIKLGSVLKEAFTALGERDLDKADLLITEAEALAKQSKQRAAVQRLRSLAGFVRGFWNTVLNSVEEFEGGEKIRVNNIVVEVMESDPQSVVIRVAGQYRRYDPMQLPGGLALAIADMKFDQSQPSTLVLKGAAYAVDKNPEKRTEARQLWEAAIRGGENIAGILPVLEDDYNFSE